MNSKLHQRLAALGIVAGLATINEVVPFVRSVATYRRKVFYMRCPTLLQYGVAIEALPSLRPSHCDQIEIWQIPSSPNSLPPVAVVVSVSFCLCCLPALPVPQRFTPAFIRSFTSLANLGLMIICERCVLAHLHFFRLPLFSETIGIACFGAVLGCSGLAYFARIELLTATTYKLLIPQHTRVRWVAFQLGKLNGLHALLLQNEHYPRRPRRHIPIMADGPYPPPCLPSVVSRSKCGDLGIWRRCERECGEQ